MVIQLRFVVGRTCGETLCANSVGSDITAGIVGFSGAGGVIAKIIAARKKRSDDTQ